MIARTAPAFYSMVSKCALVYQMQINYMSNRTANTVIVDRRLFSCYTGLGLALTYHKKKHYFSENILEKYLTLH